MNADDCLVNARRRNPPRCVTDRPNPLKAGRRGTIVQKAHTVRVRG